MTREEAVNELNDRIKVAEYVNSDYIDCVSVDAVKMAISALSVPDTNVGDMISRRAAIDAMINSRSNADVTLVPGSYTNGWRDGRKLLLDELLQVVFELPSAQRTGRWKVSYLPKGKMKYCSECGFGQYIADERQYNFCPNCGCAMKGEEE